MWRGRAYAVTVPWLDGARATGRVGRQHLRRMLTCRPCLFSFGTWNTSERGISGTPQTLLCSGARLWDPRCAALCNAGTVLSGLRSRGV